MAYNPISPLGYIVVTTAGTPVPIVSQSGIYVAAQGIWPGRVSRIYFEPAATNTGKIYLGVRGFNKTTGVGLLQTLPAPADAVLSVNFADWNSFQGTNVYRLQDYWIDADVSGEKCLVTVWTF